MRLLAAMGYGGVTPVGITYLSEYLPDDSRGFYIILMDIFKNIGGLITITVGWMSGDDWRTFVMGPVPIFAIGLCVIICVLPESSRYLLYIDDTERLEKNLNDMCKQNGKKFNIRYSIYDEAQNQPTKHRKKVNICRDLIIKKWHTTLPLALVWFFPAFGTGVYVFLPEIMLMREFTMNQIYLLSSFTMFAPMGGVLLSSIFIDTFGRKQVISL